MAKEKREYGDGRIYSRGKTLWVQYSMNGRVFRESAKTSVYTKAKTFLDKRLAGIRTNTFDPTSRNTTVADLHDLLVTDYKNNQRKSLCEVERNWKKHLQPFFGHLKAVQVTYQVVENYRNKRLSEGAANATCNREVAALKHSFYLGLRAGLVNRATFPVFPERLKEDNVRKGFVEPDQHAKLATETAKYGLWLRSIFETGYVWGWRKSEVLGLRVHQVNLKNRTVRLEAGTTKNGEGRTAVMTQPLFELLKQCCEGKKPDDAVFTRDDGEPVLDFRGAWETACEAAGCPSLLFHDLRRTAVRNMVRAGIPQTVAMKISGHKTDTVFKRYDVTDERDITTAAAQIEAFHSKMAQQWHNQPESPQQPKQAEPAKMLTVN